MAEAIVRDVADHLVEGLFLAIDYGMDQSELVVAHPTGTLAAVARHRSVPDPTAAPGRSDLSVFVNFTRVRAAARAAGLREVAFRSQAMALADWGFRGCSRTRLGPLHRPRQRSAFVYRRRTFSSGSSDSRCSSLRRRSGRASSRTSR